MAFRLLFAMIATSLLTVAAEAQESDRLIGIWGTQLRFGPTVHGPLTIRQANGAWTASIAGRKASFVLNGLSVRAEFGAEGSFRGQLVKGALHGFWVQPAVRLGNSPDPGAVSPSYATPVVLK